MSKGLEEQGIYEVIDTEEVKFNVCFAFIFVMVARREEDGALEK